MPDGWLNQRSRSFTTLLIPMPMEHMLLSVLYCSNSCTSLHFKTLKSHAKHLKFGPTYFGLL